MLARIGEQWAVSDEKWAVGDEKWAVGDESGRCAVGSGQKKGIATLGAQASCLQ
jgi:hypothetical protein